MSFTNGRRCFEFDNLEANLNFSNRNPILFWRILQKNPDSTCDSCLPIKTHTTSEHCWTLHDTQIPNPIPDMIPNPVSKIITGTNQIKQIVRRAELSVGSVSDGEFALARHHASGGNIVVSNGIHASARTRNVLFDKSDYLPVRIHFGPVPPVRLLRKQCRVRLQMQIQGISFKRAITEAKAARPRRFLLCSDTTALCKSEAGRGPLQTCLHKTCCSRNPSTARFFR